MYFVKILLLMTFIYISISLKTSNILENKSQVFERSAQSGLQIISQNLSDMMSGKNKIPSDIYENLPDINFYKCF